MVMDRDHRSNSSPTDRSAEEEIARRDDTVSGAEPAFRHASQADAMAVAERMMDRYEDVLRELAK